MENLIVRNIDETIVKALKLRHVGAFLAVSLAVSYELVVAMKTLSQGMACFHKKRLSMLSSMQNSIPLGYQSQVPNLPILGSMKSLAISSTHPVRVRYCFSYSPHSAGSTYI
jgi:hypothetical protein